MARSAPDLALGPLPLDRIPFNHVRMNAHWDRTSDDTVRHYSSVSPLAQALNLVGRRWALLVIHALLPGERRFSELQKILPGISGNTLGSILKALAAEGVLERRKASAHMNRSVYALTPWGAELREPLLAIAEWANHPLRQSNP